MTRLRSSIGILVCALALSGGAVVLKTRAADDLASSVAQPAKALEPGAEIGNTLTAPAAIRRAPTAPSAQANAAVSAKLGAAPTTTNGAVQSPPGAPQVPEESATIRDDPTIAPDSKQSADNNVSFPNDI
jgi:hypothetical protein